MMVRVKPPERLELTADGELANIQQLKDQWRKIPYTTAVANEAKKTLALLDKPDLSKPTMLANLSNEEKKLTVVQLIDQAFIQAMVEYKDSFIDATAKDFAKSLNPRDTSLDFHAALATGAARFAAKTPNIPVIKVLVGPLLALIGSLYGMLAKGKITQERVDEENSLNRAAWFESVQVLENKRIQQIEKLIKQRIKVIKKDIGALGDLIDVKLIDELKTLDKLRVALLEDKPITVNNVPLLEYVKSVEK